MPISLFRRSSAAMQPGDFLALRVDMALTQSELADVLDVSPAEVSAWEAGAVSIPRHSAEMTRWLRDSRRWEAAAQAAGAMPCPWVAEQAGRIHRVMAQEADGMERMENMLRAHRERCAVCTTWFAYAEAHPIPPVPSGPGFAGWLLDKAGPWAGASAKKRILFGAGLYVAVSAMSVSLAWSLDFMTRVTGLRPDLRPLLVVVTGLGLGLLLPRKALGRLARTRPYLAGMSGGGIVAAAALLQGFAVDAFPGSWPWIVAGCVAAGLGVGHVLARRRTASSAA